MPAVEWSSRTRKRCVHAGAPAATRRLPGCCARTWSSRRRCEAAAETRKKDVAMSPVSATAGAEPEPSGPRDDRLLPTTLPSNRPAAADDLEISSTKTSTQKVQRHTYCIISQCLIINPLEPKHCGRIVYYNSFTCNMWHRINVGGLQVTDSHLIEFLLSN